MKKNMKPVQIAQIDFVHSARLLEVPGPVAQSVTCVTAETCLTADPGVVSSIPARSHTFVEIDHEIISTANFYGHSPPFRWFEKGCCQLQAKVCVRNTG